MKRTHWIALVTLALACWVPREAHAEASACGSTITRANLVPCALEASLAAKAERQGLEAAEARQLAQSPVLPSNPVLAVAGARREGAQSGPVINWYATLSQEVEIGGQRDARKRVADAEREVAAKAVAATDRLVAAAAWRAFYEALAAREEVRLGEVLEALTGKVASATRAAADKGQVPAMEADVMEMAHLGAARERIAAAQRSRQAEATLATLMALDPRHTLSVEGELVPIAGVEAFAEKLGARALDERPEVQAREAAARGYEARASLYRRARVPNPTFSVFVQNDGFNERVVGVGLSLPIPLPGPVGRTYAGEIAESEALSRRSTTEADAMRKALQLDLANALAVYAAHRAASELYTPERLSRARESLRALATEIEAGRLAARDAILSQQALVELLRAALGAKKNLALASVELALAAGYPLEQGKD